MSRVREGWEAELTELHGGGNMLIGVVKSYAHVSGLVDLCRTMRKNSFGGE